MLVEARQTFIDLWQFGKSKNSGTDSIAQEFAFFEQFIKDLQTLTNVSVLDYMSRCASSSSSSSVATPYQRRRSEVASVSSRTLDIDNPNDGENVAPTVSVDPACSMPPPPPLLSSISFAALPAVKQAETASQNSAPSVSVILNQPNAVCTPQRTRAATFTSPSVPQGIKPANSNERYAEAPRSSNAGPLEPMVDAVLMIYEDRMRHIVKEQQEPLFALCPEIRSLKTQAQTLKTQGFEDTPLLVYVCETVAKSTAVVAANHKLRHAFFPVLTQVLSCARANMWCHLKATHGIHPELALVLPWHELVSAAMNESTD